MAARDPVVTERLERIRENLGNPEAAIAAAAMMDPAAMELAERLGQEFYDFIRGNRRGSALMTLMASTFGYGVGFSFDTQMQGAGECLDLVLEQLGQVMRFSAEYGFAQSRKEDADGAGNNGATSDR